jgi:hypothetical protein
MAVMTSQDPFDDSLDPLLQRAAQDYHRPSDAVPTEEMWAAIQAARARTTDKRHPVPRRWPRPVHWQWAAAAILLVALGGMAGWWARTRIATRPVEVARQSGEMSTPPRPSVSAGRAEAVYRVAVIRDLAQAEALVTTFRDDAHQEDRTDTDAQIASWARDLLTNTRLLLDSPAAADPQRRRLLEDLELVLVQMVELGPRHRATDRQMIDRTLDRDHVLTRLRSAVPAGSIGL